MKAILKHIYRPFILLLVIVTGLISGSIAKEKNKDFQILNEMTAAVNELSHLNDKLKTPHAHADHDQNCAGACTASAY